MTFEISSWGGKLLQGPNPLIRQMGFLTDARCTVSASLDFRYLFDAAQIRTGLRDVALDLIINGRYIRARATLCKGLNRLLCLALR